MQTLRLDLEKPFQVRLRTLGDGDDRVCHFQSCLLQPDGKVVTAAQLFPFPGTQRLERVHRDDERQAVVQLRQDPAEMAVPSMAMDHVCSDLEGVEIDAALNRAEHQAQWFRTGISAALEPKAAHGRICA
jgi:hypothetical protein